MTRIVLHVGLPKSGTSYLQKVLSANRERLAEQAGYLFPGETWNDQVLAVRDLRNLTPGGGAVPGSWRRLAEEVTRWRGDSVVSMEWLCAAKDEEIERILASFPQHAVLVAFTARDLARTVPAAWQEFMQNYQTWGWNEFLEGIRDPRSTSPSGRAFWSQQDLPALVRRWEQHVGSDRIAVVTLPQSSTDRDLLWRRFADVMQIDPDGYRTDDLAGNESLGLESAELMRRVNELVRHEQLPRRAYNRQFKHQLAKEVLAARRARESRLALPDEAAAWARELAEEHIAAVTALGTRVVGDLAELRPAAPTAGRQPDEISDSELLETALAAIVGMGVARRGPSAAGPPKAGAARPTSPPGGGSGVAARARRLLQRLRRALRDATRGQR